MWWRHSDVILDSKLIILQQYSYCGSRFRRYIIIINNFGVQLWSWTWFWLFVFIWSKLGDLLVLIEISPDRLAHSIKDHSFHFAFLLRFRFIWSFKIFRIFKFWTDGISTCSNFFSSLATLDLRKCRIGWIFVQIVGDQCTTVKTLKRIRSCLVRIIATLYNRHILSDNTLCKFQFVISTYTWLVLDFALICTEVP